MKKNEGCSGIRNFKKGENKDGLLLVEFNLENNGHSISISLSTRPNKNITMIIKSGKHLLEQVVSGLLPYSVEAPVNSLYLLLNEEIDKSAIYNTVWEIVYGMRKLSKWTFISGNEYQGGDFGALKYIR